MKILTSIRKTQIQIEQNAAWIDSAKKAEIASMAIGALGFVAFFAIGCALGGTNLGILKGAIVTGSTLGTITVCGLLITLMIRSTRAYLNFQNKKLHRELNGKNLFEAFLHTEDPSTLEFLTEEQWTSLIKEIDAQFSKKAVLSKDEKALLAKLGKHPERITYNLFFITKPTMKHLLSSINDPETFKKQIKDVIDYERIIYFHFSSALHAHLIACFGGGKPAIWHLTLTPEEEKQQEEVCKKGVKNLCQISPLLEINSP